MWMHADDAMFACIDYEIAQAAREEREDKWEQWIHTDRENKEYKIKDMWTAHIKNTIKFFWVTDYKHPLYVELSNREPLFINE